MSINMGLRMTTKATPRRVTLEHSRNMIVLTLVLVQMSLRNRMGGKVFGRIPLTLLSNISVPSS